MSTSPNIGLPFLAAQQLQPEITHNEAILLLQLMQVGVISSGSNTAPGSPTDGDSYIVGSSPTGAWGGRANTLAIYYNGSWRFVPDRNSSGTVIALGTIHEGLMVWNRALNAMMVWSGTAWETKYFLVAAQQAAIADATGGATVDDEARTAINSVLSVLRTTGIIAT
jgi:hypothetical protein